MSVVFQFRRFTCSKGVSFIFESAQKYLALIVRYPRSPIPSTKCHAFVDAARILHVLPVRHHAQITNAVIIFDPVYVVYLTFRHISINI